MSQHDTTQSLRQGPDSRGFFGDFGGRFVAETLMPLILDLQREYDAARQDPLFADELARLSADYVGRKSPLYFAERLTEHLGGARIYLKREDLMHTGAHKINNALGQILLARRMGKRRIIAETGAGMHGVATATVAARFGMECIIYMGSTDIHRQQPNVQRMQLLGAKVIPVTAGDGTLKDAMNEALRDWVTHVDTTFYIIARWPALIPILPWCVTSSRSSARRFASSCSTRNNACPTPWWPASAAAPTPWDCSIPSWMIRTWH